VSNSAATPLLSINGTIFEDAIPHPPFLSFVPHLHCFIADQTRLTTCQRVSDFLRLCSFKCDLVWKIERFLTAVLMYPANLLQIWIEEDYTSKWAVMNGRLIRFIDPSVPFCKIYPRRYCDIRISRPWIFIFIFICIFAFCLFCWGRVGGGGCVIYAIIITCFQRCCLEQSSPLPVCPFCVPLLRHSLLLLLSSTDGSVTDKASRNSAVAQLFMILRVKAQIFCLTLCFLRLFFSPTFTNSVCCCWRVESKLPYATYFSFEPSSDGGDHILSNYYLYFSLPFSLSLSKQMSYLLKYCRVNKRTLLTPNPFPQEVFTQILAPQRLHNNTSPRTRCSLERTHGAGHILQDCTRSHAGRRGVLVKASVPCHLFVDKSTRLSLIERYLIQRYCNDISFQENSCLGSGLWIDPLHRVSDTVCLVLWHFITFALKMQKVMFWSPCIYLYAC